MIRAALQALVSLALYAFLGFLLFTLWRDMQLSKSTAFQRESAFLLIDADGGRARSQDLDTVNLIGRANDNTIILDDETVSTHHARLSFQEGRWWLEDLGSKNGTRVNDILLEQPLVVTSGDLIQLGAVELRLHVGTHSVGSEHESGA